MHDFHRIFSLLTVAFFAVSLSSYLRADSQKSLSPESEIEQLIIEAFEKPDMHNALLADALTKADSLPVEKAVFFNIYITQSQLRIQASFFTDKLQTIQPESPDMASLLLIRKKIIESIELMAEVKQFLLNKKQNLISSEKSHSASLQALIDRSDFCNGWAWYSLSTISLGQKKELYIQNAEKIFTSFLSRQYQTDNAPVMVNCLYGKGLCLRDSGRYYDLITLLDSMPHDNQNIVMFARLRLAAAVKLQLSIDIIKVVQDYFGNQSSKKNLNPQELEMLIQCIESVVELLQRDLPVEMKDNLRQQLVFAIELLEGTGSYWQDRLARLIHDLDLDCPYAKILQIRYESNLSAKVDFQKIFDIAEQGKKLSDNQNNKHNLEFLYMQSVSAWNLAQFEIARSSAIEYISFAEDADRIAQLANIVVQSDLNLIGNDHSLYHSFREEIDNFHAKGYIGNDQYYWSVGLLLINSGKYKLGFEFFSDQTLTLNPPIKKQYGLLMAIVPMLKDKSIDDEVAVKHITQCCRIFLDSKEFQSENIVSNSVEAVCQAIEILQQRNNLILANEMINIVSQLPHIRQEAKARIIAIELSIKYSQNEDLSQIINLISEQTLQHNPLVFNSMINLSNQVEQKRNISDQAMADIYLLMLSSNQLNINNSVAIRIYLAQCYFRLKQYKDYIEIFGYIEDKYKSYISADNFYQLALANQELKNYKNAAKYWSIVQLNNVILDETGKQALFNRILCIFLDGDKVKAAQILQLAFLKEPALVEDQRFQKLHDLVVSNDNDLSTTNIQWSNIDQNNQIQNLEKKKE